jgi:hypothetical protein
MDMNYCFQFDNYKIDVTSPLAKSGLSYLPGYHEQNNKNNANEVKMLSLAESSEGILIWR